MPVDMKLVEKNLAQLRHLLVLGSRAYGIRLIEEIRAALAGEPKAVPQDERGFPWLLVDLHPATKNLVVQFAGALADKLHTAEKKYGYSDGWASNDWMDECRAKLREHVEKGDPRDVAAYCAFLWHHKQSTIGAGTAPAPAMPEEPHALSAHDHGNCELCDALDTYRATLRALYLAEVEARKKAEKERDIHYRERGLLSEAFSAKDIAWRAQVDRAEQADAAIKIIQDDCRNLTEKVIPNIKEQAEVKLAAAMEAVRDADKQIVGGNAIWWREKHAAVIEAANKDGK